MNDGEEVTNYYGFEWPQSVHSSEYYRAMNRHDQPSAYYNCLSKTLICPSLCLVVSAHPPSQKNYLANAVGLVLGQDVVKSALDLKFRTYSAGNPIAEKITEDIAGIMREGGTQKVICVSDLPVFSGSTELEFLISNLKKLVEDNLVTIIVCLEIQKTTSLEVRDLSTIEPSCDLICAASIASEAGSGEIRYVNLTLFKNRYGDIPKPFKGPWPFLEASDVSEDYWQQFL